MPQQTEKKPLGEESSDSRTRPAEHAAEGSPGGKMASLYPPHFAGIQDVEVHGDEELGLEHIPEKTHDELQYSYGGDEDGDPPEVSQEELDILDKEATKVEIERMLKIPAMEESTNEEVTACSGYTISTKMVYTWKHRVSKSEIGGKTVQRKCGRRANIWPYIAREHPANDDPPIAQRLCQFRGHDLGHQRRFSHGRPAM